MSEERDESYEKLLMLEEGLGAMGERLDGLIPLTAGPDRLELRALQQNVDRLALDFEARRKRAESRRGARDWPDGDGDIPANGVNSRDKRAAFVRLAEKRTNAVLERVRILGNLSNRNVYAFDETDVNEIFSAIENKLELARNRFASTTRRRPEFRLTGRADTADDH